MDVAQVAQRYTTDGGRTVEGMTRDELCVRYGRKVQMLARRIHERMSRDSGVLIEDLVSCGSLGLLEAFDRFDPGRGIQFSTYAEYRIRGAMYDALRDNDVFSRRHRQLAKRVQDTTEKLRQAAGMDPAPERVADELGIGLDEYWSVVDRTKPVTHVSLDAPDRDDEGGGRSLMDRWMSDPTETADQALVVEEVRRAMTDAILALPERHRDSVLMYYGKGLTLAEIALVYEITVSRVSQILSEARDKLRKKLQPVVGPDDAALEFNE